MADIIDNQLIISTRTKEEMKSFLSQTSYDKKEFSYDGSLPMPKEIRESNDPAEQEKWKLANWGIDLDAEKSETTRVSDNILKITFLSIWGPPVEWLRKTSERFGGIKFSLSSEMVNDDFTRSSYIVANGRILYKVEQQ